MPNGLSPNGPAVRMGTVSHGTLRTQDLLRAFADEIEYLGWTNGILLVLEARHNAAILDLDVSQEQAIHNQTANAVLDELYDALNRACPPGVYFGTLEGDASDFGFWQYDEDE